MTPILLLHGALGSKEQLEPLRKLLLEQGRDVYSLNFSGHSGEPFSEKGFGIEIFANDVIHFLDKHQLKIVDIFGYSMGGYVALWCAHLHPDRINKIITLGTKFDWNPPSAEKEVSKMNAEKIIEKVPAFARLLEHRHAPIDWIILLNKTKDMMTALGNHPLLTLLNINKIQNPCTIILGDMDDMADRGFSEKVAQSLPHAQFYLLANTPHPIEKVDLLSLVKYIR